MRPWPKDLPIRLQAELMEQRNRFAAAELTACGTWRPSPREGEDENQALARHCFEVADAMLRECLK